MIHPHPSAPDGSVTHVANYNATTFAPADAVLCRNVAPLITFAFTLIRHNVGVRILGREIGASLVTLIKSVKAADIKELEQKLIQRRSREIAKALKTGNESAVAAIEDKFDCLNIFLQNSDDIDDLIFNITDLFDETKRGLLTLSTIHKAKGMEWNTVFLLDFNLLPSKWAMQSWMRQQERNLQYVAVTRAKEHLKFISSGKLKEQQTTVTT